ncbi:MULTISPECIES: helix-turn-helix domain-containing protein [unclassified Streptomyces]|uniref:helix-turn-helix domain-containing protein n=1 Tax=unclassified Streptomyces TaxID=2593676 RepID=UPI000A8EF500|nr:helix-turn-helix transcriptional regulator [Streptomyces sp. C8S0]
MGQRKRKDIDGSQSVPCFYGKELRFQREKAGLSMAQLVEGSFYGTSYLSEIERGQRRMPVDLARHVDRTLGTDGYFELCCEDVRRARQGAHASYFAPIAEAETRAQAIDVWANALIPGLLQTEAYGRAANRATDPFDQPDAAEAKLQARLARASLFDSPERPEYWAVLHESLIFQPLLSPVEMAVQLEHVAALAKEGRIVPQVLPWNVGTRSLLQLPLMFLEFDDEPTLVYTEGPYHGQIVDDPWPREAIPQGIRSA